jgi:AraC family transcriptional regulator, transcriptional activator of pobA
LSTIYRTLQDFFSSIGLSIQQDFEMTVHQLKGLHGSGKKEATQFRTDYFSFLLITAGKSSYTIDGQLFALGKGSFYFTLPGHVKSFNIVEPIEGYMVTFTERFLKENFSGNLFKMFPFLISESTPVMTLNAALQNELIQFFEVMIKEYALDNIYKKELLSNYLSVLLFKTKSLLTSHRVTIKASSTSMKIANEFKQIIDDNFKQLLAKKATKILSIKEVAALLKLHPNYLTNVIKEETGKSATAWIHDKTITEAQFLIKNENFVITEIANCLGFTDSTHFAKFFKKHVGVSPSVFRKNEIL